MEGGQQLIASYELLLQQSKGMLELARRGDWAALLQEKSCGLVDAESLRQLEARISLGQREQQRKFELLEQILALDAEIRTHLLARRDELGRLIVSSGRQRELNRTYRPGVGAAPVYQAADRFDKGLP
ncbi:flagellar protein FliT [Azotobacter chroococcum]|uniref:Flagellar protein FliT n=1 Tax=Azotobacter chroococcum TaxID=353 RepID=A0AA43Z8T3_9GAMM|nr:flagellar protein FliT [Azotobacter chroococcum]NHN78492.1 flagellar protein FliT [Azotobacter chroococcum]TBW12477.1 flagellar protein FliT [Azotobacter chroococcum subsp. isscasi]